MSIFDKDGNKSYKEYELSAESREKITKGILEGVNNEPAASRSELDVRRIEKMNKRGNEIFKKIAVASVSLIATGAIILGVVQHNKFNKNDNKVAHTVRDAGEFVPVYKDYYGAEVTVGDYIFTKNSYDEAYIESKKTNQKEELSVLNGDDIALERVYTDGKTIVYDNYGCLYVYDIETKYKEKIDVVTEAEGKIQTRQNTVNGRYTSDISQNTYVEIAAVKNGNVYLNYRDSVEDQGTKSSRSVHRIYMYALKRAESKLLDDDREISDVYDDFVITKRYLIHKTSTEKTGDVPVESMFEVFYSKLTKKGFEDVKSFGEHSDFYPAKDQGDVIFFERYNTEMDDNSKDKYEITLISYDRKSGETKDLATIKKSDFTDKEADMYFELVELDSCVVVLYLDNGEILEKEYHYDTKKIEDFVSTDENK